MDRSWQAIRRSRRTAKSTVRPPRVSEPVALSIAMAAIAAEEKRPVAVALLSRSTTKVRSSLIDDAHEKFVSHPDGYVFTIELEGPHSRRWNKLHWRYHLP